jgi:hypothetical protein
MVEEPPRTGRVGRLADVDLHHQRNVVRPYFSNSSRQGPGFMKGSSSR